MIPAYLGLGSNLEQPERQLSRALEALAALPRSRLARVSAAYRSAAVGPGPQPEYLNAVARLDTELAPAALLAQMQAIERAQGRLRTVRWGPRTLDLDLLLYGDRRIETPHLQVPHPGLAERDFVLYPLAEIAGEGLLLPDGTDLATLLRRCPRGDLSRTGIALPGPAAGGEADRQGERG